MGGSSAALALAGVWGEKPQGLYEVADFDLEYLQFRAGIVVGQYLPVIRAAFG